MISISLRLLAAFSTGFFLLMARAADEHDHHDMTHHDHFGTEPIGVMGAHAHGRGDWMVSLRSMRMDMDGNRDGTSRMSTAEVFAARLHDRAEKHDHGHAYAERDVWRQ